jgi:DNA-binding CsgD family transcriptional regulator
LIDTKQEAQQEVDTINTKDLRLRKLLHQRARDSVSSLRWNVKTLIFVYAVLIIVIILTILGLNSLIVASVAVLGLVMIWLFSWLKLRNLEKKFYQQEIHDYKELLSSEPRNNHKEKSLGSVSSMQIQLTPRELEILIQMATGKINKQIAYDLGISEMTVKNHIRHIFWKLDVDSRTAAVLLSLRRGLIKYDDLQKLEPERPLDSNNYSCKF